MAHDRGIRLLTYNVKMLPEVVKLFERPILRPGGFWEHPPHAFRDRERAATLAQSITAMNPAWDLICLQELFSGSVQRTFERALAADYRCIGRLGGSRFPRLGHSGLFLATRLPILEHRFEPYRLAGGTDRLCDKGVLHVVLDAKERWPETPYLHVFATHAQAWPEHVATRLRQLSQAREFLTRRLREAGPDDRHAAVLCGDFNVIAEHPEAVQPTEEYHLLRRVLGRARDLYRELHPSRHGSTWDSVENPHMTGDPPGKLERLDYVFALDSVDHFGPSLRRLVCRHAEVLKLRDGIRHLSDHFALETLLET
ncbi:MAG: sphingomyelin phosphodiesterase [Polyangiaceae bacterium]|nr:sphingomyelin phosphodiesterase [Polyangiaceae bacterium]